MTLWNTNYSGNTNSIIMEKLYKIVESLAALCGSQKDQQKSKFLYDIIIN